MTQCNYCSGCDDGEIGHPKCNIDFLFALWAYRPVHVCPPLPGTTVLGLDGRNLADVLPVNFLELFSRCVAL